MAKIKRKDIPLAETPNPGDRKPYMSDVAETASYLVTPRINVNVGKRNNREKK